MTASIEGKRRADGPERVSPKKEGPLSRSLPLLSWVALAVSIAGLALGDGFVLTGGVGMQIAAALLLIHRELERGRALRERELAAVPPMNEEQSRRARVRELRGQLISALALFQKLTAAGIWDEVAPLQRLAKELERELQEAAGKPKPLSDDERFYFGSIYRSLRFNRDQEAERSQGATVQGEILSDNLEWLDCWLERRALKTEELGR